MFDSFKLSDLHNYATVFAVIAAITFVAMLLIQSKYNRKKTKRLSVKNFQSESEIAAVKSEDDTEQVIECVSYKPKEADKTGEKIIDPVKLKEAAALNELLKKQKPISIAVDEIYAGEIKMKEYHSEEESVEEMKSIQTEEN